MSAGGKMWLDPKSTLWRKLWRIDITRGVVNGHNLQQTVN